MSKLVLAVILAHSWYSSQCCGDHDCHPVPCQEIQYKGEYIWYGPDRARPSMIQASQDGQCHVCVNTFKFVPDRLLCVYMPGTS